MRVSGRRHKERSQKRLGVALAIYAVLGCAAWLTMSAEPIALGSNRQVSMRLLTVMILAVFAVRTLLAWKADQIRMKDAEQPDAAAAQSLKG
jgi:ABC-type transport system involved in cytochrome bd biosynthesis fused ATPase/permease subunit